MKKSEAEKLYKLIEKWTRAEIMARFGDYSGLGFADYYQIKLDLENKMRKLVFKTDNIVELGEKWKLLETEKQKIRKKKRKKK